jgi:hypothetical protein
MDVCVRLFCVCVVVGVGSGLRRADPASKDSYRLCIGRDLKKAAKAHKGCGAIEK